MLEALWPSSKVKFKWFFHFSSHFYYILNETLVKKDDVLFMHFFSVSSSSYHYISFRIHTHPLICMLEKFSSFSR